MFQNLLHNFMFKWIAGVVLVAFMATIPASTGYAQLMPKPGQMVYATPRFTPALTVGLRVDPKDPFNLYFVMSKGEKRLAEDAKKEEYKKLIKYFMASLVTPNDDMWVNLSPKEAERIIPDNFSLTEMGRDLLAQDYLLKQFTASLMAPDRGIGKEFWKRIYEKAYQNYGTTEVPIDTFNKVWIMADQADIYQKGDTAFLVNSHLKVMLEQDFMAIEANKDQFTGVVTINKEAEAVSRALAADIVRTVIVPEIEKEVNEGSNFVQVRQIYNAMILATWFKKTLKDSLLGQVYADQSKVAGIATDDLQMKDRIYQEYLEAYKTGVFNYIKEELDVASQEMLPRKYFAGGMVSVDMAMINTFVSVDQAAKVVQKIGKNIEVASVRLNAIDQVGNEIRVDAAQNNKSNKGSYQDQTWREKQRKKDKLQGRINFVVEEKKKATKEYVLAQQKAKQRAEEKAKAEAKAKAKADKLRTAEKIELNEMNKASLSGLVPQAAAAATAVPERTSGFKRVWKKYVIMGLMSLQLMSGMQIGGLSGNAAPPANVSGQQTSITIEQPQEIKQADNILVIDRWTGAQVTVSDTTGYEELDANHPLLRGKEKITLQVGNKFQVFKPGVKVKLVRADERKEQLEKNPNIKPIEINGVLMVIDDFIGSEQGVHPATAFEAGSFEEPAADLTGSTAKSDTIKSNEIKALYKTQQEKVEKAKIELAKIQGNAVKADSLLRYKQQQALFGVANENAEVLNFFPKTSQDSLLSFVEQSKGTPPMNFRISLGYNLNQSGKLTGIDLGNNFSLNLLVPQEWAPAFDALNFVKGAAKGTLKLGGYVYGAKTVFFEIPNAYKMNKYQKGKSGILSTPDGLFLDGINNMAGKGKTPHRLFYSEARLSTQDQVADSLGQRSWKGSRDHTYRDIPILNVPNDILTEYGSRIPIIGKLFVDGKAASVRAAREAHTAIWEKVKYPAVIIFGNDEKAFYKEARLSQDKDVTYLIVRDGEDAVGVKIDLKKRTASEYFRAPRFRADTKAFCDAQEMWLNAGEMYVIPSMWMLEQIQKQYDIHTGANNIKAGMINPVTGEVLQTFTSMAEIPMAVRDTLTRRVGNTVMMGQEGVADVVPSLNLGLWNKTDTIHPIMVYSQNLSLQNFFFWTKAGKQELDSLQGYFASFDGKIVPVTDRSLVSIKPSTASKIDTLFSQPLNMPVGYPVSTMAGDTGIFIQKPEGMKEIPVARISGEKGIFYINQTELNTLTTIKAEDGTVYVRFPDGSRGILEYGPNAEQYSGNMENFAYTIDQDGKVDMRQAPPLNVVEENLDVLLEHNKLPESVWHEALDAGNFERLKQQFAQQGIEVNFTALDSARAELNAKTLDFIKANNEYAKNEAGIAEAYDAYRKAGLMQVMQGINRILQSVEQEKAKSDAQFLIYEWLHQIAVEMMKAETDKVDGVFDGYVQKMKDEGAEAAVKSIVEDYKKYQLAAADSTISGVQHDITTLNNTIIDVNKSIAQLDSAGVKVPNPYGFKQDDVIYAQAEADTARMTIDSLNMLGQQVINPYDIKQIDINYARAEADTANMAIDSLHAVGHLIMNPYDIKQSDIDYTRAKADTANMTIDNLNALGQNVTNPYEFTTGDVTALQAQIDTANMTINGLNQLGQNVTNPYQFTANDIIFSQAQIDTANMTINGLNQLGQNVTNPYQFTTNDITSLQAQIDTANMTINGLNQLGQNVTNPYQFTTADITAAQQQVSLANTTISQLNQLGQPITNPYQFTAADISAAQAEIAAAQQTYNALGVMLSTNDFTDLGNYIPSQGEITAGQAYWNAEKNTVINTSIPYWQTQLTIAQNSGNTAWVGFVNSMITSLNEKVTMIDQILYNLGLDELIVQGTSTETPEQTVTRKMTLEQAKITYNTNLVTVLQQGTALNIQDWSGLGDFIPSQAEITAGQTYWNAEKNTVINTSIPYWQTQLTIAQNSGNTAWVGFVNSMITSLNQKVTMIDQTLSNLGLDELIVQGTSTETPQQIVTRKVTLEQLKVTYNTNLVTVLQQGMALNIQDWSGLGNFIPSQQQITAGQTYWNAEKSTVLNTSIPYWQTQLTIAQNSGNAAWVGFVNSMITSLNQKVTMIDQILSNLGLDEQIVQGTSTETPQQIVTRKVTLEQLKVTYNTNLITVLQQGMALNIQDWSGLGNFIPSQQQITAGQTYWNAEKSTVINTSIPYWQTQLTIAQNAGNAAWVSFVNNMIASLNQEVAMIDQILSNLGLDEQIVQGTSTETPQQIVARKVALEQAKIGYYTNLITVLQQGTALNIQDWSGLGNFIPSQQQITEGQAYWNGEKNTAVNTSIPYWQTQLTIAQSLGNTAWVGFVNSMITSLNQKVAMIDQILYNLGLDALIVQGTSTEMPPQIAERKVALEQVKIAYNTNLITVLQQGMVLNIEDWSGIGDFIPSQEQINASRAYLNIERDSTLNASIPYWQTQRALAIKGQNATWVAYTDNMILSLNAKLTLIEQSLLDLAKDEQLINGTATETPPAIVARKVILEQAKSVYYTNLDEILQGGMVLEIQDWSGLGALIPSQQQITDGIAYWTAEKNTTLTVSLPYWQQQLLFAQNSGNAAFLSYVNGMIASLNEKVAMIDKNLFNLAEDQKIVNGTSTEALEVLKDRKIVQQETISAYYTHVAALLEQGMVLQVSGYGDLGNFIPSQQQITDGIAYWNAEKNTTITVSIPYWQQQLASAQTSVDAEWASFVNNMISSLNEKVAMIDLSLAGLAKDALIVGGTSTETPQQIVARKIALEQSVQAYYLHVVEVLKQGMLIKVTNLTNLLIPIETPAVDDVKTPDINETMIGKYTDDPGTVGDESKIYIISQVISYWNTDDRDTTATEVMGRLERIKKKDIAYWERVRDNKSATPETKVLANDWIANLNKEYQYGDQYVINGEAKGDQNFQSGNPDQETPEQLIARKKAARQAELTYLEERVALLGRTLTFYGELLDKDKMKDYQEWISEQIGYALDVVDRFSGFGTNPMGQVLTGLEQMGNGNEEHLKAKKAWREKRDGEQTKVNAAYDAYFAAIQKYDAIFKDVQDTIIGQVRTAGFSDIEENVKQVEQFLNNLAYTPPGVVRKGGNLVVTIPDANDPKGKKETLIALGSQEAKQYIETAFTSLKDKYGKLQFPSITQFGAFDVIPNSVVPINVVGGQTMDLKSQASATRYAGVGVTLSPEDKNYVLNALAIGEQRSSFLENYGSTEDDPKGTIRKQNYVLLLGDGSYMNEKGDLFFDIKGLLEVSTGEQQLWAVDGKDSKGKDKKTKIASDEIAQRDMKIYGISGAVSYNANKRLFLKLEGGFAKAEGQEGHEASIIDVLSGDQLYPHTRVLNTGDAFARGRLSADIHVLENGKLDVTFALNHEKEGFDEAFGTQEKTFGSVGVKGKLPGGFAFQAEKAVGDERVSAGVSWKRISGGFVYYDEDSYNYGVSLNVAKDVNASLFVDQDGDLTYGVSAKQNLGKRGPELKGGVSNNGVTGAVTQSIPNLFPVSWRFWEKKDKRTDPIVRPLNDQEKKIVGDSLFATTGSWKFQVGEFKNDLNKVTALIGAIAGDLQETPPVDITLQSGISWLNDSTLLVRLLRTNFNIDGLSTGTKDFIRGIQKSYGVSSLTDLQDNKLIQLAMKEEGAQLVRLMLADRYAGQVSRSKNLFTYEFSLKIPVTADTKVPVIKTENGITRVVWLPKAYEFTVQALSANGAVYYFDENRLPQVLDTATVKNLDVRRILDLSPEDQDSMDIKSAVGLAKIGFYKDPGYYLKLNGEWLMISEADGEGLVVIEDGKVVGFVELGMHMLELEMALMDGNLYFDAVNQEYHILQEGDVVADGWDRVLFNVGVVDPQNGLLWSPVTESEYDFRQATAKLKDGSATEYIVSYPSLNGVGTIGTGNEYYKQALADALAQYYLVIWKNKAPEYLTMNQIKARGDDVRKNAKEVLQQGLDAQRENVVTTGRVVKMYGKEGYKLVPMTGMDKFLKDHWMLILENDSGFNQGAEFITIDQLKDPAVYKALLGMGFGVEPQQDKGKGGVAKGVSGIEMQDKNKNVVGRIYLSKNMRNSKVELIKGKTSKIYKLVDFNAENPQNPVAETVYFDDKDGLRHVITTNLLQVNDIKGDKDSGVPDKPSTIEEVFRFEKENGKEKLVLLYRVNSQREENTYFKDGQAQYAVSTNMEYEKGQRVIVDGAPRDSVVAVYEFDKETSTAYSADLRNFEDHDGRIGIRVTEYDGDLIKNDKTGFVQVDQKKLSNGELSANDILKAVKEQSKFLMDDDYEYLGVEGESSRKVSVQAATDVWGYAWEIKSGQLNSPQPELVSILQKNPVIAAAFEKYGINVETNLIESYSKTVQFVKTTDYRIPDDVQDKKFITVREQVGSTSEGPTSIIEIIVGLEFDEHTGEQTRSYVLTPDYQVKSMMVTVENKTAINKILPPNIAEVYAELAKRRYGGKNAEDGDLWGLMEKLGIGKNYVPVKVEEIPFLVVSDNMNSSAYKSVEPVVRELIEKYQATENNVVREQILKQIRDIVRERAKASHYSDIKGQSTFHYLIPNDSRGRDIAVEYSNGEIGLTMWWFEGKKDMTVINGEKTEGIDMPINISPGVMVVSSKDGSLQRSMLFKHSEPVFVENLDGDVQEIQSNFYAVLDAPIHQSMVFSAGGQVMREDFKYVRNRIINGKWGVQTKGIETVVYDIHAPYQTPSYGILDEDGRITQVPLNKVFSVETDESGVNLQKTLSTSIETSPTAPDIHQVHTTTFLDSKYVTKTREDVGNTYLQDIKNNWRVIAGLFTLFFTMIFSGWVFGIFRKGIKKAKASSFVTGEKTGSGDGRKNALTGDQTSESAAPGLKSPVVEPSWDAYGFEAAVVANAKRVFENSILNQIRRIVDDDKKVEATKRKDKMEKILAEYFEPYQVWRETYMEKERFKPTVEDLWVLQLILGGSDILSNDMPDYISYLFDKTLEAREAKTEKGIAGFVRKEFTRWHNIIQIQPTTFQSGFGGAAKHVVPYQYYFKQDDLNDLFRMKGFVDWYDGLGYTIDRTSDVRDAIYADFTKQLKAKVDPLISDLKALATTKENNTLRMKSFAARLKAYKDYVSYFKQIQKGENQLSDAFAFEGVTRDAALKLIKGKPLMAKTFSDTISENGRSPHLFRVWKSALQVIRTGYQPIAIAAFISTAALLGVLVVKGSLLAGTAVIIGVGVSAALYGAYHLLNYILDHRVNTQAFGKAPIPSKGFKKPALTTSEKVYRGAFWSLFLAAKVALNAFMFSYFLIPGSELLGAMWGPAIPLIGSFNFILLGVLWLPAIFFSYLDSYSIFYLLEAGFAYIQGKVMGLGIIKTGGDIKRLQKNNNLNNLIDEKLLPKGLNLNKDQREKARKAILNEIFRQMRTRDEISDAELEQAKNGTLDKFALPRIQKRVAVFVNSLLMKMPEMPRWEDIKTSTVMIPYYDEDIIYSYDPKFQGTNKLSTVLGPMMKDVGYTNLNYAISREPKSWEFFIERMEKKGVFSDVAIANLRELLPARNDPKYTIKPKELELDNEDLKMEIRMWASYQVQAMARTWDGIMNYVRMLRIYAAINHPEWDESRIREEVKNKVQVLWAHQQWGKYSKATENDQIDYIKRQDTIYLLKKYHEELGFDIELASLQDDDKYKVLSKVDPRYGTEVVTFALEDFNMQSLREALKQTPREEDRVLLAKLGLKAGIDEISDDLLVEAMNRILNAKDLLRLVNVESYAGGFTLEVKAIHDRIKAKDPRLSQQEYMRFNRALLEAMYPNVVRKIIETKDVYRISLSGSKGIIQEGKPGNQTQARSFATGELTVTMDMNQDFYPEQIVKLPILFQEFDEPSVDVVGYPEDIFTANFAPEGGHHAIADRTFVTSTMRVLAKLGVRFHYGHPDIWRSSSAKIHGGVSSTSHVNEDIIAGIVRKLKGKKIIFREYIEAAKAREVSWFGTDGIFRKFGMGGLQQALGRFIYWVNKDMNPDEVMAFHFGGIGYYLKKPIVLSVLLTYVTGVMLMGVSIFTAFTSEAVLAAGGIFLLGQAIVLNGYFQKILEDGFVGRWFKGTREFSARWVSMTPFYMAHVFTAGAGAMSAMLGLAAYVSTGRGYDRDHKTVDLVIKNFGPSHIFMGTLGTFLAGLAIRIWYNPSLWFSAPFVAILLFGTIIPFVLNPGALPIRGVSLKSFWQSYTKDLKILFFNLDKFKSDKKKLRDEGKGAFSAFVRAFGGALMDGFVLKTFSNGKKEGNWRKMFLDTAVYGICALVWFVTIPVATLIVLPFKTAKDIISRMLSTIKYGMQDLFSGNKKNIDQQSKNNGGAGTVEIVTPIEPSVAPVQPEASELPKTEDKAEQIAGEEPILVPQEEVDLLSRQAGVLKDKVDALDSLEKYLDGEVVKGDTEQQKNMDASQEETPLGGIDMGNEHLTINIKVDDDGMPLAARFQDPVMVNIQGLSPVIRDITPISSANMPAFAELMK